MRMITSKRILLAAFGLIVVMFVTGLTLLRKDLFDFLDSSRKQQNLKSIQAAPFHSLDFSSNWIVSVKQGNDIRIDVDAETQTEFNIKSENGILYCLADTSHSAAPVKLKITAPALHMIRVARGTQLELYDFSSDSISLALEDGVTFTGTNNNFKHISFKTSGDVSVQMTKQ